MNADQEIAIAILRNCMFLYVNMYDKHIKGVSIESDLEEISCKISLPEEVIKDFLKRNFIVFANLA
ncbi:MAG: hypothetical protein PHW52_02840 [Candidatus Pacebacteria bacterium]|nr:hypothetical protein [Candidatus Paceibacterota bacterium]